MADEKLLSKVKIGSTVYDIKDTKARTDAATAQGAITAEVTRATTVEGNLETRVSNLESRGRFLSNYVVATGLPTTYPDIPSSATTTYTYEFKSGDYYIVGSVPASGKKYMPSGASITATKSGDTWSWEVGKAETTDDIAVGDQFVYDGANWVHIAAAKDVVWGNIVGTLSDQSDLNTALGGKLAHKTGKSGAAGDLAYKDSASASYTPEGTIAEINATPAGSVTLNAFTQTPTAASITEAADYTPAGTVTGTVVPTGSVTLNAFTQTATDINSTGKFTPAGTVALSADAEGSFQVGGTNASSAVTFTKADDTFVKSLKAGDTDAASIDTSKFSGGSFTGATQASFTQGAKASFTQGAKAALTTANITYVEGGVSLAMDTTDAEMLVVTDLTTKTAKAVDTFTANGDDSFTANGDDSFIANSVGTFTAAAIADGFFSAQKLPVVDGSAKAITGLTDVTAAAQTFTGSKYKTTFTGTEGNLSVDGKYDKATANGASFTGNASGDAITATFAGTKVEDLIPTTIKYDKATANGASFSGAENKITPTFSGTTATVTVS